MNAYEFVSENMCGLIVIVAIIGWTVSNVVAIWFGRSREEHGE